MDSEEFFKLTQKMFNLGSQEKELPPVESKPIPAIDSQIVQPLDLTIPKPFSVIDSTVPQQPPCIQTGGRGDINIREFREQLEIRFPAFCGYEFDPNKKERDIILSGLEHLEKELFGNVAPVEAQSCEMPSGDVLVLDAFPEYDSDDDATYYPANMYDNIECDTGDTSDEEHYFVASNDGFVMETDDEEGDYSGDLFIVNPEPIENQEVKVEKYEVKKNDDKGRIGKKEQIKKKIPTVHMLVKASTAQPSDPDDDDGPDDEGDSPADDDDDEGTEGDEADESVGRKKGNKRKNRKRNGAPAGDPDDDYNPGNGDDESSASSVDDDDVIGGGNLYKRGRSSRFVINQKHTINL